MTARMSGAGSVRGVEVPNETVINWQAPPMKFGLGATEEIGEDLRRLGVSKALVVSDRHLEELGLPRRVAEMIPMYRNGVSDVVPVDR